MSEKLCENDDTLHRYEKKTEGEEFRCPSGTAQATIIWVIIISGNIIDLTCYMIRIQNFAYKEMVNADFMNYKEVRIFLCSNYQLVP